jgi:hypothetical protein
MDSTRNNTGFPLRNYETLSKIPFDETDIELYHQKVVKHYLINNPYLRGLLVFWGMGYGKTRMASITAKKYIDRYKVIIIAPKSVFTNFMDEFKHQKIGEKDVKLISLKTRDISESIRDNMDSYRYDDFSTDTSLENTLVIIDEAHNLFNSITNGSKNAIRLYDKIMNTKNIKLLFLTGSPIINKPFELAPCFNMLHGSMLFPEHKADFDRYFVHKKNIMNVEIFKNRIFGLLSYYGPWIQKDPNINRPKRLPVKMIDVEMSMEQYNEYAVHREKERKEIKNMGNNSGGERFGSNKGTSSYKIRSRMACNMVGDGKLTRDTTPKFFKILDIINKSHNKQPGVVYSNFVNKCGLKKIAELLETNGWSKWGGESTKSTNSRFAFI